MNKSKVINEIESKLITINDPKLEVDLLNQLIIESRDSDSTTSLKLAQKTLKLATDLNYKKGVAYSILSLGYLNDFQGNKKEALSRMEEALGMFKSLKDKEGMGYAYKYLCWYYWGLGQLNTALKLMLKGLKLNEGSQTVIEGWALFVIGVFYSDMKDFPLGREYLENALKIFNCLEYEHGIGRTLNALSTISLKCGENDKALELGYAALEVHTISNYQMGLARSYNDIGVIYSALERYEKSIVHLNRSLNIRKKAKNRQAIITTLIDLGNTNYLKQNYNKALDYLNEAEQLAFEIDATAKRIRIKQLMISIYEAINKPWEALKQHKAYFNLNETYLTQDTESRIKSMEAALNEEKKERQIQKGRLKNAKLKLKKQRVELLFGQQVSSQVVNELLSNKDANDIRRTDASIMFLDIRNFTVFAQNKDPEEVISFQNNVFSPLIEIITSHNGIINQFMGDGFMASFGIPVYEKNHCQNAYEAGLNIVKRMRELSDSKIIPTTQIGIGLHTGEVISGNIGNKIRKQFSIAGENVIVAARLEQLNKHYKSKFLISQDVFDKIKPKTVELVHLGKIHLKGFDDQKNVYRVC